ncbi:tyrosine--tRNA ligase, partial [Patescibacteria group bacterium]|nr:tyrosine--tRNA ligase [Patescibacteria group bacterium]
LQGIGLIKNHYGNKANAHGLTFPLLTTSSGEKMGKTVSGPLWLDPNKTSPFDFYQYLEKIPDQMVSKLFGLYTFLPMEEISRIVSSNPREAQKVLAYEVTKVVHGEELAKKAMKQSKTVFTGNTGKLDLIPEFLMSGSMVLDELLVDSGSLKSKSEVSRRVKGNAVKIDEISISDPKHLVSNSCLIKYGKKDFLKVVVNH